MRKSLLLALGALLYLIRLRRREKRSADTTSTASAAAMDPSKLPMGIPSPLWQSPAPQYSPPVASPEFTHKSSLQQQQQQQQQQQPYAGHPPYAELSASYTEPVELSGSDAVTTRLPLLDPDAPARDGGGGGGGGAGGQHWSR